MALVTGYAVYFGGGRKAPQAQDGVSGGSLTLDFDPSFGSHHARGTVNFPELGRRTGDFFTFEGVFYFVPDNPTGLPSEFEGRVLAIECAENACAKDESAPTEHVESAPAQKAKLETSEAKPKPAKRALDLKLPATIPDQGSIFFDIPEPAAAQASPDVSLSQCLRSAFEVTDDEELCHSSDPEPTNPAISEPTKALPVLAVEAVKPELAPEPEPEPIPQAELPVVPVAPEQPVYIAQDLDDWAVYLQPQPTIKTTLLETRVIEVLGAPKQESADQPDVIDLVLVGEEKETFQTFAQEVVETIDSFETIKKQQKPADDEERLLAAELAKLVPDTAGKAPRKLFPWIKRDETEEEMLERLTIKSAI